MIPAFRLLANRKDITQSLQTSLLSLRLTDEAGTKSDCLDITLEDTQGFPLPPPGTRFDIGLGYEETGLVSMGAYLLDEIEVSSPPASLVLRAKAANFTPQKGQGKKETPKSGLQSQKTRVWEEKSVKTLVESMASEHGYEPVLSPSLASIQLPTITQTAESDMNLLTRLAEDYGAVFKLSGEKLLFVKTEKGDAQPSFIITPQDITNFRAQLAMRGKFQAVKTKFHNKKTGKTEEIKIGTSSPVFEVDHAYSTQQAARAAAPAKLEKLKKTSAHITITLPGNPAFKAGGALKLQGFREGINGLWTLKRVEHTLSQDGFTTNLEAEL